MAVGLVDGPVAEVGPEVVDVDLVVTVASDGSGLRVDYAAEGFSADWVRGLLDQTVTLLSAGVREPGVPLSGLPLLGTAERDRLLAWGRGPVCPVPGEPLHELVLEWARRTPDAVAGVADGEVVTYGELARRSELLARYLRAVGVGVGDVVSLALDRSMWTLVATLAVLRAGAAYTPMDVSWPAERMKMLLADHGAQVVLTVGEVAHRIPRPDGVRVVAMDHGLARRGGGRSDRPAGGGRLPAGVRDLHVRIDRDAEGRRADPRQADELRHLDARRVRGRPGQPDAALLRPGLRRGPGRDLHRADLRRPRRGLLA